MAPLCVHVGGRVGAHGDPREGPASRVAPIDKLSLPLTILLATVWLGEPLSWRLGAGVFLMTMGALLTLS